MSNTNDTGNLASIIVDRIDNLAFLSQCHASADLFNQEFENLLGLFRGGLEALKQLAAIQTAWLQAEAEAAQRAEEGRHES